MVLFLSAVGAKSQTPCSGTPNAGTIYAIDSLLCTGDSVFLTLTGLTETGLNFQWQHSLNGITYEGIGGAIFQSYSDTISQSKWFRCVVTCVSSGQSVYSGEQYIQVSTAPPSGGMITETGTGSSFLFSVTGMPAGYEYAWNFGDGNTSTLAAPSHTYAANGTYNVSVVITNGCGSDTLTHTTSVITGITDYKNGMVIRIFPNPTNDGFNLHGESTTGKQQMKISDISGRVYRVQFVELPAYISTKNLGLEKGTYFIELGSASENTVLRLIIE